MAVGRVDDAPLALFVEPLMFDAGDNCNKHVEYIGHQLLSTDGCEETYIVADILDDRCQRIVHSFLI